MDASENLSRRLFSARRTHLMDSNSNYELLDVIGRGEMTAVYRARDYALKRNVAIKELDERYRQDPRRLVQFCEEAQFLANLEHDNIVHVYGIDKQRGWMIMELMQGNLAAKAAEGALPADLVRSVIRQVLEALEFLHGQGRVHGQIRPGNLLINDQGRVKLSDFVGTMAGNEFRRPTHGQKYIAPELLKPEFGPVGPTVDLYALGFVALELLMGPKFNSLFKGVAAGAVDADLAWMRWHTSPTERLPSAAQLVPGLPSDLATVIDRMLEKEVASRCPSAGEALRQLSERPLVLIDVPAASAAVAPAPPVVPPASGSPFKGPAPQAALPKSGLPKGRPAGAAPKPSVSAAPLSREWINQKLEKPWVLYPLCSLIIAATAYMLFRPEPKAQRKIALTVKPAGAKLIIDDEPVADPADLSLAVGDHQIQVSLKGYDSLDKKIAIEAGEKPQVVALVLRKSEQPEPKVVKETESKRRKVAFEVSPAKAKLFVDGSNQAAKSGAELELTVGEHRVRAELTDYEPLEKKIDVKPGADVQKIALALKSQSIPHDNHDDTPKTPRRKVKLALAPAGAKLFIDDASDPTPVDAELELSVGEHHFRAESPGFKRLDERVKVTVGKEPQRIRLAMIREPAGDDAARLPEDLVPAAGSKPDFEDLPDRVESKKLKAAGAPLEFVLIPPGEFLFGSPDGSQWTGELPQETAKTTEPFYLATVETTNRHYDAFAQASGDGEAGTAWRALFSANAEERADWPAVMVSWEQAAAFCRWLNGELPSEQQWERAARGTDGRPYPWGEGELDVRHANLRFSALGQLAPVAALADGATPLGIQQLLGNAAEWCRDEYGPGAGDDSSTPGVQERWHVIRGGSFKDPPAAARAMMRANCAPEGADDVGFRVAIPVKPRKAGAAADR